MWVYFGGFILHLIFLMSMFDIYFKTPIVPGIPSLPNPVGGTAKRLVFIVADGLRAESFFSNNRNSTPFLRYMIENHASWGVSHTRVPTESRPGIVALAAGIYEDPSAVFKGWKENPAEFDTIFNQSRHTWAWGSPDIVHMFTQGKILLLWLIRLISVSVTGRLTYRFVTYFLSLSRHFTDKVETMSYKQEEEEFFGKNSSWMLDSWVFNKVALLFNNAKTNSTLNDFLRKDKLIFFLHLLGLDTAGHAIKPLSLKYQENLVVVDKGVQDIEKLFENFYSDGSTAYVFTADHGMTDWGSHGAGSKDETEVPLVAWGPGIKGPEPSDSKHLSSPKDWHLGHLKRRDLKQADIVTLLAGLIGCSIPVNSVGRLPRSYLDFPDEQVAKLVLYNALQLSAQAHRKQKLLESRSLSWLFKPYSKLTSKDMNDRVQLIQQFIMSKEYKVAIQQAEELGELSNNALQYYHNYYQGLLLTSTSLSFLGWITWLICQLNQYKLSTFRKKRGHIIHFIDVLFTILAIIIFLLIQVQGLNFQFNVYFLLPIFLWRAVFGAMYTWKPILSSSQSYYKVAAVVGLLLIFVEIMVAVFFQRWVLSVGVLVCAMWPLCSMNKISKVSLSLLMMWLLSCAAVAVFPLLPVIGSETSISLVQLSALLWILMAGVLIYLLYGSIWSDPILFIQLIVTLITVVVVSLVANNVDSGQGLPLPCQVFSWFVLTFSPLLSILGEKNIDVRLVRVLFALLPPYLLLSVRQEALFLFALSCNLMCWLHLEAQMCGIEFHQMKKILFLPPVFMEKSSRNLTSEDIRRAALFVFYIFLSFFGTGNIASLNSFEITWVRCFISVFSPFTMMVLILFKMTIPFVIVSGVFRAVNITFEAPTSFMFIVVLAICDLMGLQFLHYVTNEGSWLDIGTSISHYVIVQVTVLALVMLYGLSSILTGVSVWNINKKMAFQRRDEQSDRESKPKRNYVLSSHIYKRKSILP